MDASAGRPRAFPLLGSNFCLRTRQITVHVRHRRQGGGPTPQMRRHRGPKVTRISGHWRRRICGPPGSRKARSIRSTHNTGVIGHRNTDMFISLNAATTHARLCEKAARSPCRDVRARRFLPAADIIGQILNLVARDDRCAIHQDRSQTPQGVAYKLPARDSPMAGIADHSMQQSERDAAIELHVDPVRRGPGRPDRKESTTRWHPPPPRLAGNGQTAPNVYLNPKNGVSYGPRRPGRRNISSDSLEGCSNLRVTARGSTSSCGRAWERITRTVRAAVVTHDKRAAHHIFATHPGPRYRAVGRGRQRSWDRHRGDNARGDPQ